MTIVEIKELPLSGDIRCYRRDLPYGRWLIAFRV